MTALLGSMGAELGRTSGCLALANLSFHFRVLSEFFRARAKTGPWVGRRIFSIGRVPIVTAFFAKWLIVEHRNDGERGISHASLYSLRDHHFDCDRSWRLLGTPRKSRGRRAVEARLDDDDGIALLTYLSGKCQPPVGFFPAGVSLRPLAAGGMANTSFAFSPAQIRWKSGASNRLAKDPGLSPGAL